MVSRLFILMTLVILYIYEVGVIQPWDKRQIFTQATMFSTVTNLPQFTPLWANLCWFILTLFAVTVLKVALYLLYENEYFFLLLQHMKRSISDVAPNTFFLHFDDKKQY